MSDPSPSPTPSSGSAGRTSDRKPFPILVGASLDINPFDSGAARETCLLEYHLRDACRSAERRLHYAARLFELVASRHPELLAELDAGGTLKIPGPDVVTEPPTTPAQRQIRDVLVSLQSHSPFTRGPLAVEDFGPKPPRPSDDDPTPDHVVD
jgi:hypothetical protein